jgi:glutamate-5-semialdehyde dehydrogenase
MSRFYVYNGMHTNGIGEARSMQDTRMMAVSAREASIPLSASAIEDRNNALRLMADVLKRHSKDIFAANEADMKKADEEGLASPLKKRLLFDENKLLAVQNGLLALAELDDPLRHTQLARELMPGLKLYRVSCPIGVVGVIFESRPDALVQIASLCLKSGNTVLLKGGREAEHTNRALMDALLEAAREATMPDGWAALLTTREEVRDMLKMDDCIDLIIPRGSNEFVRYIMDNSRIPVLGHADGICHVYVDASATIDMAVSVTVDSKTQYVAVCNAAETLLVHKDIAETFLPSAAKALAQKNVRLRGCERTRAIIPCEAATEEDWKTEYLDYILSVKVVDSVGEAIRHINHYGSGHTDTIVAEDMQAVHSFMSLVDSAGVYHNCSTRFADGFCYGFGAEVGIATGKLHARGPMGLEGLCSYKYLLFGSGQTLTDVQAGKTPLAHKDLEGNAPL